MSLFIEISVEAEYDLEDIFDYTEINHSIDQAFQYVSSFDEVFDLFIDNPRMGKQRLEIRRGLFSFVKDSHVIFYRILSDRFRIVRILHASRDLHNLL